MKSYILKRYPAISKGYSTSKIKTRVQNSKKTPVWKVREHELSLLQL